MLDEKKMMAIELLVKGELTKTEIAKRCGKSRQWLYNAFDDKEFMAELDRRLHQIQTYGENRIKATLQDRINNIIYLAENAESEKVRLDASQYLLDRVLGKTTSKMEIKPLINQDEEVIDIDEELEEIEIDEEE